MTFLAALALLYYIYSAYQLMVVHEVKVLI